MMLAKKYDQHEIPLAVHVPAQWGSYQLEVAHYELGRNLSPKQLEVVDEIVGNVTAHGYRLETTSTALTYQLVEA